MGHVRIGFLPHTMLLMKDNTCFRVKMDDPGD